MNPKISKLKAERAKNDGKIAMLQSRNREIDEDSALYRACQPRTDGWCQ